MSEGGRGRVWVVVWGVFIVFAGLVLLLQALNVLSWALWGTLWRFWPCIIIIAGITVLLRGRMVWLTALLTLAVLGACLGIAAAMYGPIGANARLERRYSFPATGIDRANLTLDFSAGRLEMATLDKGSNLLLQAEDTNDFRSAVRQERSRTMQAEMTQSGATASINIKPFGQNEWAHWRVLWRVLVSGEKPLNVDARCDASEIDLDFSNTSADIRRLLLNASSGRLVLPSSGRHTADIDINVSNLEIIVPAGTAARIDAEVGLGILDVDTARFPRQGGVWVSPDYDSASNRISVHIRCDVSTASVK